MDINSSFINRNNQLTRIRQSHYWRTKLSLKTIMLTEHKVYQKIIHFFVSFHPFLEKTLLKLLRDINNKLNLYTQLKREYNFQNSMEENYFYMINLNNGPHKSILNILIISEKKTNQQNYFNC